MVYISTPKMEAACPSKTFLTLNEPHGGVSQKTELLLFKDVLSKREESETI
jgi:hypothetical protein